MTKDYKAAYRYARSFFLIMKAKAREAQGHTELDRVLAFSGSHPEFSRLLLAANLAYDEKFEIIKNLFSSGENKLSADTSNFIKLLVEKGRFNLFEKIAESYRRYFDVDRGLEEVTAVVPFALSGDAESRLVAALEKKLGKKILLSTRIDRSIWGGMIVQTHSQVIDGSFQGKLRGLRQQLLSAGREN